jgi:hypothetical protein
MLLKFSYAIQQHHFGRSFSKPLCGDILVEIEWINAKQSRVAEKLW